MRIAFFSDNFYPELSGLSDSIISLGKELVARRHEIAFFVPRYSAKNYRTVNIAKDKREPNIGPGSQIVRLPSLPFPTPTTQGRLVVPIGYGVWRLKYFRPDIVHTHLIFGAGIEALIGAKFLGCPFVGTNHTAIEAFVPQFRFVKRAAIQYSNWYYKHCNIITTPSKAIAAEMRSSGFKKEVRIVSNPIDTKTFCVLDDETKHSLWKKFSLAEGPLIVHAGRLSHERSVATIIKAFALLLKTGAQASLVFAGKGAAEADLKRLTKELGIDEAVHFMGFLDKTALNELYNLSEMFVITSTSDTQSMVMMQAMAAGLPTVGVHARALPEYLAHENGIVVPPEDAPAIAEAMEFMLTHPRERKTMGKNARAFVETLSVKHIADMWENIYKEAARYRK